MNTRVSVVIPAYQCEETIARTLESIAFQTAPVHEVVVVDNNCTDRSMEIAEGFSGRLPMVLLSCSTPGSGAARNTGIQASTGDLIAFLDADDVWFPEKLERQLSAWRGGLFFSGTYMVYTTVDGRAMGNNVRYADSVEAAQALKTAEAVPCVTSSIIVSRDVVDVVGGFDESFLRTQDFEWMTRVAQHVDLTLPDREPHLAYTLQPGAASHDRHVEQALAADSVRKRARTGEPVDYDRDVLQRLAGHRPPRALVSGQFYRSAGVLISERKLLRGGWTLLKAVAYDPVGVVRKLLWQKVGAPGVLPAEVRELYTA